MGTCEVKEWTIEFPRKAPCFCPIDSLEEGRLVDLPTHVTIDFGLHGGGKHLDADSNFGVSFVESTENTGLPLVMAGLVMVLSHINGPGLGNPLEKAEIADRVAIRRAEDGVLESFR